MTSLLAKKLKIQVETSFYSIFDIIFFLILVLFPDIILHVCNRETFGYMPLVSKDSLNSPFESFAHLRIEHLLNGQNKSYNEPLPISQYVDKSFLFSEPKSKLGFDEIYIINLERRPDRKKRISSTLDDLGLSYKIINAVDGQKLTKAHLQELGIEILPNYKDPYRGRSLTLGEIGCFLSHFIIWVDVSLFEYLLYLKSSDFQVNLF